MYSGVTPTMVLRYINRSLGAVVQYIELSQDEIMRVVFQESLPTYSEYFPNLQVWARVTAKNCNGNTNEYFFNNDEELEIIGVHKVFVTNNMYGGAAGRIPTVNPFSDQQIKDMISATTTPITWTYHPPYKIIIRPKIITSQAALIQLKTVHPKHLKTIGMNMREHFLKLCLYDVLLSLYPIRHRFESMQTPAGDISPFLTQVDSAEANRDDLLEYFQKEFLKNSGGIRIFSA